MYIIGKECIMWIPGAWETYIIGAWCIMLTEQMLLFRYSEFHRVFYNTIIRRMMGYGTLYIIFKPTTRTYLGNKTYIYT